MQARTEFIQARLTRAEAEKLNVLTQRLGVETVSETLRTLIDGASVEPRFVLAINLPEKANGDGIRQDTPVAITA